MDQLPPAGSFRLENQVAIVTGGARGIGAGIVKRFAQEGARVVFSDLLNEEGKGFEEELGKNVAFYRAHAASASDTEALMNFRGGTFWQARLRGEQRRSGRRRRTYCPNVGRRF